VWAAATWVAGESLRAPQLGTLQEGAPADLLLFRNDPVQNPGALGTLEGVGSNGQLYPREALSAAVSRYQRYFTGRVYDAVSRWYVRRATR
jgi:hypothetical protein